MQFTFTRTITTNQFAHKRAICCWLYGDSMEDKKEKKITTPLTKYNSSVIKVSVGLCVCISVHTGERNVCVCRHRGKKVSKIK